MFRCLLMFLFLFLLVVLLVLLLLLRWLLMLLLLLLLLLMARCSEKVLKVSLLTTPVRATSHHTKLVFDILYCH